MKLFLNVLAGIVLVIALIGGPVLFYSLEEIGVDPSLYWGIAVGAVLNCLITAAVLLAMAEGLWLLEKICEYTAPKAATQTGGMTAVRAALKEGGERRCPRCNAEYRGGITKCPDCGIALEETGKRSE